MTTDIYTYQTLGVEFPTNQEAREYAKSRLGLMEVTWGCKFYDKCQYHGDSEVGIVDGKEVIEIKCLMNHHFCNPWDDHVCGYTVEND